MSAKMIRDWRRRRKIAKWRKEFGLPPKPTLRDDEVKGEYLGHHDEPPEAQDRWEIHIGRKPFS